MLFLPSFQRLLFLFSSFFRLAFDASSRPCIFLLFVTPSSGLMGNRHYVSGKCSNAQIYFLVFNESIRSLETKFRALLCFSRHLLAGHV